MLQFEKKMLDAARMRLIKQIEKKKNSRVICMIHRRESAMAPLRFPFFRCIGSKARCCER